MQILKKFKNPVTWVLITTIKFIVRKLFFNNIENNDFKRIFSYTLDFLPNETFINIFKLLINVFRSKPSELYNHKKLSEIIIHLIPSDKREGLLGKLKFLFLFLIAGNVLKRTLFLVKNIIIFPFKIGVYSFIAFLFGIKLDWLLAIFDIFKFNLPSWTFNKLLELHLSWMLWFKNNFQISSINTEFDPKGATLKTFPYKEKEIETIEPDTKPDKYFYLTKTQWIYLGISAVALLAAYFGYTGGIPFTKTFEFNSDDEDKGGPSGRTHSFKLNPRGVDVSDFESDNSVPKTWQDTFTELLKQQLI